MRKFLPILISILIALSSCALVPNSTYQRFQAHRLGLFDTLVILIGYAESEEEFSRYADILFGRLEVLHRYYDIFNAHGGINNIYTINANAGIEPVEVSQEIIDLLLAAKEAYRLTGGMTNVALGSVLRVWHDYRSYGLANPDYAALPSVEALLFANQLSDMSGVIIDAENGTVFLERAGMSLDVGSIAKGFAAELAVEAATEAGASNILLSAGGHIVTRGIPPGRTSWSVGVQNPDSTPGASSIIDALLMTNSTVSISGGHLRFFDVDGQSFGHIIDPTTLLPASSHQMVAVVHPISWMADVVSTALFILPMEEGKVLANQLGVDALWIDFEGNFVATDGYMQKSTMIDWDGE